MAAVTSPVGLLVRALRLQVDARGRIHVDTPLP